MKRPEDHVPWMWTVVSCLRCGRSVVRKYPQTQEAPKFCAEPCKKRHNALRSTAREEGLSEQEIEERVRQNRIRLTLKRTTCPRPDKWGYGSRRLAAEYLRRTIDHPSPSTGPEPLNIYRCRCGLWHIGHHGG